MVRCLRQELGLVEEAVIHFDDWLKLVQSSSTDDNPAWKLSDFLGTEFRKMSCGDVILDTAVTRAVSPTLRRLSYIEEPQVKLYLKYWRSMGLLS